jgi:hypothetical protein
MIKRLKLFLLLFILTATTKSGLMAQSLIVRLNNGNENSRQVSSLQKLSFVDGNLIISYKADSTASFPLADIQKVYFGSVTLVPEAVPFTTNRLTIYPNPVGQELNLLNIPANTSQIFIYRMDGKMMLKMLVSNESETINVSSLASGMYLLVANGESVKFIKL